MAADTEHDDATQLIPQNDDLTAPLDIEAQIDEIMAQPVEALMEAQDDQGEQDAVPQDLTEEGAETTLMPQPEVEGAETALMPQPEAEGAETTLLPQANDADESAEQDALPETIVAPPVSPDDELEVASAAVAPVIPTQIVPKPAPSFDEEHGSYIGERYEQDYSRMEMAYQDPKPERTVNIPHYEDVDGAGHHVPGEGKSRSKARPFLAFLLVGLMVAGIVAAGAYGLELWGGKHLPNVVGLSAAKARAALENKGFVVDARTRIADDGIGFVLEQDPEAGLRIAVGSHVTVVVATNREMPDVVGRPQAEAEDLLSKAGAVDVRVVGQNSAEAEGTVLSVTPSPGEPFTSHQTISLVVAQKPVVPDVLGKGRVEAVAELENAGLRAEVTFVVSDAKPGTVALQDPAAGTKLDPDSVVVLSLSQSMPASPLHLLEFFDKSTPNLSRYFPEQGFTLKASYLSNGFGEVLYTSKDKGNLVFTARPYSHAFDQSAGAEEDVLANGAMFAGVRWEVPASKLPASASKLDEAATKQLMDTCGLSNVVDVCTEADITVPEGTTKNATKFRCTYGEAGGYVWTVLLANESSGTRAVVTAAPKWLYADHYDLSAYGDSVCDMVAYADVYTEW